MLSGEAANTDFIGLTQSGLEPTIYRTRVEHANYYTTEAVWNECDHGRQQSMASSSIWRGHGMNMSTAEKGDGLQVRYRMHGMNMITVDRDKEHHI